MQNPMKVKYLNPNDNCYGDGAKFALMRDGKQLAVMTVYFADEMDISTPEDFRSHVRIAEACEYSPHHASAIMHHTIMTNWPNGADSFEVVFEKGDLPVDPKLYSQFL